MKKTQIKQKRFNYKWVIVALSFLMVFICMGFCHANKSLYLGAITKALDLKRSAFSVGDSIRFITTAVVNLFFGYLIQKFGTKKLICAGFVSLIASMLIYAFAHALWQFYIAGAFLGIGMSWTSTTMVGAVVNKWCRENRGTITGAVLASSGIGAAFAAQIVTPIIYDANDPFGYRNAYKLIVLILVVVGSLVVFFYKDKPKDYDENEAPAAKKRRGQSWGGISFEDAIKKPCFYVAAVCIFLTGMVLQGVNGITATYMADVGIDVSYVATVLTVHSLVLTVSKFIIGVLYDRFGLRFTVTVCDASAVIIMLLLATLTNTFAGRISAMVYAFFAALVLPLETVMLPIFANDIFGDKSYNKFLGIFVSINTAGYAVGIPLANIVFDVFGSYRPMFWVCIIIMAAITVTFQFVVSSAHRMRSTEQKS